MLQSCSTNLKKLPQTLSPLAKHGGPTPKKADDGWQINRRVDGHWENPETEIALFVT
jgi:hypothetical protein